LTQNFGQKKLWISTYPQVYPHPNQLENGVFGGFPHVFFDKIFQFLSQKFFDFLTFFSSQKNQNFVKKFFSHFFISFMCQKGANAVFSKVLGFCINFGFFA